MWGGGFGSGVHSTIEPALYGIPIAVGPNGTGKFSEIRELVSTGQLKILRSESDLIEWGRTLNTKSETSQLKSRWIEEARSRLGATQKIWGTIEKLMRTC